MNTLDPKHRRTIQKEVALLARAEERVILSFDAAHTPCGCDPHFCAGFRCTPVAWRLDEEAGAYQLRCLECGGKWTRPAPRGARGDKFQADGPAAARDYARRRRVS